MIKYDDCTISFCSFFGFSEPIYLQLHRYFTCRLFSCSGGYKRMKIISHNPPITLFLTAFNPPVYTLFPLLRNLVRGCAWVVEELCLCKALYAALCMLVMHGTCCARLGAWAINPKGFCWRDCPFVRWRACGVAKSVAPRPVQLWSGVHGCFPDPCSLSCFFLL